VGGDGFCRWWSRHVTYTGIESGNSSVILAAFVELRHSAVNSILDVRSRRFLGPLVANFSLISQPFLLPLQ
jgi:hypothetical protein